jgi:cell wall assembly regulator SMI1
MGANPWPAIIALIEQISPPTTATLRPPAVPEKLAQLEELIGRPLPQGYRAQLLTFDGQDASGVDWPLVGYNRFQSVDDVIACMREMSESFADEPVPGVRENKIRAVIWDRLWLPFAEWQGQLLVLDLNPGEHGILGQVFQYWPGYDIAADDAVLASSFEEFADRVLLRLGQGDFTVADGVLRLEPGDEVWLV